MTSGRAELRLPPDVVHVGLARLVVTQAARLAALGEDRIEDLRIAVSEAVTNAVVAHNHSGAEAPIRVAFGPVDSGFEVAVTDTGPGFEPMDDPMLGRDWSLEGGLGVTLIRGLADSAEFLRDGGMSVRMTFAWNGESADA